MAADEPPAALVLFRWPGCARPHPPLLLTGDPLLCVCPAWLGFPPRHSALRLRE